MLTLYESNVNFKLRIRFDTIRNTRNEISIMPLTNIEVTHNVNVSKLLRKFKNFSMFFALIG